MLTSWALRNLHISLWLSLIIMGVHQQVHLRDNSVVLEQAFIKRIIHRLLDLCRSNPCCSRVNCTSFSLLKLLTHFWLWPISLFVIICCVYIPPPSSTVPKMSFFGCFSPKELVFHFINNIWPAFIHFLSYFINVLLHLNHFLLLSFHVSFFTFLNWVLIYL